MSEGESYHHHSFEGLGAEVGRRVDRIEQAISEDRALGLAVNARLARLEPAGAQFGADLMRRLDYIQRLLFLLVQKSVTTPGEMEQLRAEAERLGQKADRLDAALHEAPYPPLQENAP